MTQSGSRTTETSYYQLRLGRDAFAPQHWGTWLIVALVRVLALLPLPLSRLIGGLIGLLMLISNAKRRAIARVNLELCFPQLSPVMRRRMLWHHYIVSGQAYVDLGLLAWASKWRLRRILRLHGVREYRQLASTGQPIILLAPHCVGMNFGGSPLAMHHPMFSMYKSQRSPVVNWLLNKGRMRFGCRLVSRDQGMRPVVRGLKQGISFYYLPDEDLGPKLSVFAPFFGIPTATLPTLGRLCETANAVVVPVYTRLTWRGYDIYLRPPLENFPSGDKQADATRMNAALEEGIRLAPEQYMWTFKLFKTRPNNEPSPYPQGRI